MINTTTWEQHIKNGMKKPKILDNLDKIDKFNRNELKTLKGD